MMPLKMFMPSPMDFVRHPSIAGAFLVSLLPLVGFFLWGWTASVLVLVYWLENLVIGVFALLRMTASVAPLGAPGLGVLAFAGPFFILHFGGFCTGHGAFIMLLANAGPAGGPLPEGLDLGAMVKAAIGAAPGVGATMGVIAAWKGILFLGQFLRRGDYLTTNPIAEMFRPYSRIVTLHLAIFAGFLGLVALGEPAWGMLILIGLKTAYDVAAAKADAVPAPSSSLALLTRAWEPVKTRLGQRKL